MNKMLRNVLTTVMVACMMVTMMPTSTQAATESKPKEISPYCNIPKSGQMGDDVHYEIGLDLTMTLRGTGATWEPSGPSEQPGRGLWGQDGKRTWVRKLVVCEGIESVSAMTFLDYNFSEAWLPASIDYIGWSAFACNEELTDIYYAGTESQWKKINIEEGYDNQVVFESKSITIHYNVSAEAPKKVANVTTKQVADDSVVLTWTKNTGVFGFQIKMKTGEDGKYVKVKNTRKSSATISDLEPGTYYFKVRAFSKDENGKKMYGKFSKAVKCVVS